MNHFYLIYWYSQALVSPFISVLPVYIHNYMRICTHQFYEFKLLQFPNIYLYNNQLTSLPTQIGTNSNVT